MGKIVRNLAMVFYVEMQPGDITKCYIIYLYLSANLSVLCHEKGL